MVRSGESVVFGEGSENDCVTTHQKPIYQLLYTHIPVWLVAVHGVQGYGSNDDIIDPRNYISFSPRW